MNRQANGRIGRLDGTGPADPIRRYRRLRELAVSRLFLLSALVSVLTTMGIIAILAEETIQFLREVSIVEFLFGTEWTALFKNPKFGVLPLVGGTLLIALYASVFSIPIGLGSAIYLSEYASERTRRIVKPILEILAGIPSIVYGYFALTFITPLLRPLIPGMSVFNALSAAIAVGIMTIPLVSSLSEDAMRAVPDNLREGAYALGSTRFEVATRVVVPAALSSIMASFVLAISRAVGETMIVALAAGSTPRLTLNPLESIQTMTGFIVQVASGDIVHGGTIYKTIFAVGMLLFLMTLVLNMVSRAIVRRYREEY